MEIAIPLQTLLVKRWVARSQWLREYQRAGWRWVYGHHGRVAHELPDYLTSRTKWYLSHKEARDESSI